MIDNRYKINFVEFVVKNIFWYAVLTLINNNFNPTEWWIYQSFWGGVLFVVFEFFIFSTCITDLKDNNDGY